MAFDKLVGSNVDGDLPSAILTALDARLGRGVSVSQFGAVGDGVTDDTAAIQAALDFGAHDVYFPAGTYLVTNQGVAQPDGLVWYRYLTVPGERRLYGPGVISYDVVYAARGLILSVQGSNVTIEGLTFQNTQAISQTWSLAVGLSPRRDAGTSTNTAFENLTIRDCTFINDFYMVTVDMGSDDVAHTSTFRNLTITGCRGVGSSLGNSGAFDAHYCSEVRMENNHVVGATFASTYNFVGTTGITVVGNYARGNGYAACQIENGSGDATVSGNTFIDCGYGVWIDDSSGVTVSGNYIEGGATGRRGVYISREGYTGNTSARTSDIVVSGNTLVGCFIYSSPFGTGGGGVFGRISVVGNVVEVDGVSATRAIQLSSAEAISVVGNTTTGGTDGGVLVLTQAGQITTIQGNTILKGTDAGALGLVISGGLGTRLTVGNVVEHASVTLSGSMSANLVAGTAWPELVSGFTRHVGTGSPEGVLAASKGSIFQRLDGGAGSSFYVKESGTGNTGWIGK